MMVRRPTPAELGLDVTIAMAAITTPDGYIVTVSDRMISYDDVTQAVDNATIKAQGIAKNWGAMFAAADARLFMPIVGKAADRLRNLGEEAPSSADIVKREVAGAYQDIFEAEFTARHLSRLRFRSIDEFRKNGLSELGPDVFGEIFHELSKFDLGIQLLCYGFSGNGYPNIFQIENPGRVTEENIFKYAVIGSGYWMASASLRRRPLTGDLADTIYRLLEAKFSAETATGVGRATTVMTFDASWAFGAMTSGDIDKIRNIWSDTLKQPEPVPAIEIIERSRAVRGIVREER
jgi:hypothetical protein